MINFNSSMVRLRVTSSLDVLGLLHHFNSSMVRLRASENDFAKALVMIFQFQYGAIEREDK